MGRIRYALLLHLAQRSDSAWPPRGSRASTCRTRKGAGCGQHREQHELRRRLWYRAWGRVSRRPRLVSTPVKRSDLVLTSSVWVCCAALAIVDRLDLVDRDLLGAWLSERQLPNGGLNGRPEKLEDVSSETETQRGCSCLRSATRGGTWRR